jgi:hypothetical protein
LLGLSVEFNAVSNVAMGSALAARTSVVTRGILCFDWSNLNFGHILGVLRRLRI